MRSNYTDVEHIVGKRWRNTCKVVVEMLVNLVRIYTWADECGDIEVGWFRWADFGGLILGGVVLCWFLLRFADVSLKHFFLIFKNIIIITFLLNSNNQTGHNEPNLRTFSLNWTIVVFVIVISVISVETKRKITFKRRLLNSIH